MGDARIRFSCLLTLSETPGGAFTDRPDYLRAIETPIPTRGYLQALNGTGLGVRVMSLNGGMIDLAGLNGPQGTATWAHAGLFTSPVAERYVNAVAAAPGLILGHARRARPTPRGTTAGAALAEAHGATDDVAYLPQTALAGRFTVGVPNVAFTCAPTGDELDAHERQALSLYDVVITHSQTCAVDLERAGIPVALLHPDRHDAARTLRILFEQLLESKPASGEGLGGFPNF